MPLLILKRARIGLTVEKAIRIHGDRIDKRFPSKGREVVILSRFRDDEAFAVNGLAAILVNGEHDNAIKYR